MALSICYVAEEPDIHLVKMIGALVRNPDFAVTLVYFSRDDEFTPRLEDMPALKMVKAVLYPDGIYPYPRGRGLLRRAARKAAFEYYRCRAVRFLRKYFRMHPPDVAVGMIVQLGCDLIARTGYHPFVAEPWGSDVMTVPYQTPRLKRMTLRTLRAADAVLLHSAYIGASACRLDASLQEKCIQGPWGIDCGLFARSAAGRMAVRRRYGLEDKTILFHCRGYRDVYGLEYLLAALHRLLADFPDLHLLVLGWGDREEWILGEMTRLRLRASITIHPPVENSAMPRLFSAADLYVQCNLSDGPSTALQEAMACELPVVTTDIPGYRDIMGPEKNGWYCAVADVDSLEHALRDAMANKAEWRTMGLRNRKRISDHYDWNRNYTQLWDIFNRMARNRRVAP